jgi:hypothetical protein
MYQKPTRDVLSFDITPTFSDMCTSLVLKKLISALKFQSSLLLVKLASFNSPLIFFGPQLLSKCNNTFKKK